MNYIIHGENVLLSRDKLNDIKKGFDSSLISVQPFRDPPYLENNMFSETKVIVIEFFEKDNLKVFNSERLLNSLKAANPQVSFVLWFGFEVTPSNKLLGQVKEQGFREMKFNVSLTVFKLADSFFAPKIHHITFYKLLCDFSRTRGDEVFFVQMLIRKVRFGLWASFDNASYRSLSGFLKQSAEFGKELPQDTMVRLYGSFVNLEGRLKSGTVDISSLALMLYESF